MSIIYVDKFHAENILQQFWKDCENEELCDVVVIAGNEETRIPAHRNILSAASEYFKIMFQSSMRESRTKEIKMPSANGALLRSLIEYCYIGRVAITEDNAVELLKLADLLLLSNVVTACGNFLSQKLHLSNCLELAVFAEQYRCETLLKKAKNYTLEHIMDVSKTKEFLSLNSEQLGEFLASDNLSVSAEENVFEILMTWIQHDQIEREKYRDQLLKLVRLPLLERSFLIKQVKPICTSIASHQLYYDALEWSCLPDERIINARKSGKSFNSDQFLMCLTYASPRNINFYCPQRRKWMGCLKDSGWSFYESSVAVMHDNLYVVGNQVSSSVRCINLKSMTTVPIKSMTERRQRCCVAVLNGFLYAVGGDNGNNSISSVEKYDPITNTWSEVASMTVQRWKFGLAQLNGKLYAVGGASDGKLPSSAEYYDVDQNVWKSIASAKHYHESAEIAVADGLLYVVSASDKVECYNPRSNNWTMVCGFRGGTGHRKLCTTFCNKVVVHYNEKFYEYNHKSNEWKTKETLDGIKYVNSIFAYSGELSISSFADSKKIIFYDD